MSAVVGGIVDPIIGTDISGQKAAKKAQENALNAQIEASDKQLAANQLYTDKQIQMLTEQSNKSIALQQQTFEYAKASKNMGDNYFVQIKNLASKDIVKEYFQAIEEKKSESNEIIVLSAYAYDLDICFEDFIVMWTKKNLINIAVTSLKISRIKPSEIQQMLFKFDEILENLGFENIGNKITNFNPLFEEIIFSHKNLEPKMFTT